MLAPDLKGFFLAYAKSPTFLFQPCPLNGPASLIILTDQISQ